MPFCRNWDIRSRGSCTAHTERGLLRAEDADHFRGTQAEAGRPCQKRKGSSVDRQTSVHRQHVRPVKLSTTIVLLITKIEHSIAFRLCAILAPRLIYLVTHQRTQHSIVVRPSAVRAISPFARRSFSTAAPLTWNSLPPAVLNCDSLSLLSNPDLKLICFLLLSAN